MPEITPGPAERLAYSVDEVAQITGLSRDLLYDQMRTGRLGYIKSAPPHHHPPAPGRLPRQGRIVISARALG
jgi:predicted DNA-binding transcriptional regulator AlpA